MSPFNRLPESYQMKLVSALVLGLFAAPALAQSTAFTYQGSLKNESIAASGTRHERLHGCHRHRHDRAVKNSEPEILGAA